MARTTLGFALAFSLVVGSSAFADSFTFASPGSTIWSQAGVYVNPYTAHDNTLGKDLTIYCDDWNTDFSGNPTWNATVYALTSANLPNFKFSNTTQNFYSVTLSGSTLNANVSTPPFIFTRYLEAAWLDEQWQNHTTPDATVQTEIAAAVWTLFVDDTHVAGLIGAINNSGFGKPVYDYLQGAEAAVAGGYTAAGWDVIVPDRGVVMQEFLVHAPEPGAVILLGTLVGLLAFAKFRRRVQA